MVVRRSRWTSMLNSQCSTLNAQLSIPNSAFPAQPLLPSISTSVSISIYLFRGVFFKEGL